MSAVYSTRFLAAQGRTTDIEYHVPAGFIAVIRQLDVYASTGLTAGDVFLEGHLGQAIYSQHWTVNDAHSATWQGRQVFNAGETITVSPQSIPIDLTLSGYLLTTP